LNEPAVVQADLGMRVAEVMQRIGKSKPTLYRLMAKAGFPRPFMFIGNVPHWRREDVEAWLRARVDTCAEDAAKNSAKAAVAVAGKRAKRERVGA
jgi:predicted DNA-binding transcriptional regulator AlpA